MTSSTLPAFPTLSTWMPVHDKLPPAANALLMSLPEYAVRVDPEATYLVQGENLPFVKHVEKLRVLRLYIQSTAHGGAGYVYPFVNVLNTDPKKASWRDEEGRTHPCIALVPINAQRPDDSQLVYTMPSSLQSRISKGQVFMDEPLAMAIKSIGSRDPDTPHKLTAWAPRAHSAFMSVYFSETFEDLQAEDIPLLQPEDKLFYVQRKENSRFLVLSLTFRDFKTDDLGNPCVRLWAHGRDESTRRGLGAGLGAGSDVVVSYDDDGFLTVKVQVVTRRTSFEDYAASGFILAEHGLHETINARDEARRTVRLRELDLQRESRESLVRPVKLLDWVSLTLPSARQSRVAIPPGLSLAKSLNEVEDMVAKDSVGRIYVKTETPEPETETITGLAFNVFKRDPLKPSTLTLASQPPRRREVPVFSIVASPVAMQQLITDDRVYIDPIQYMKTGEEVGGASRELEVPEKDEPAPALYRWGRGAPVKTP